MLNLQGITLATQTAEAHRARTFWMVVIIVGFVLLAAPAFKKW